MGAPPLVRRRFLISGRVQGVGFRWTAQREASSLELKGWVRNLSDGRVEALAEGPPERVEAFQRWCHQGPPSARVTGVDVQDDAGSEPLGPFTLQRGW